VSQKILAVVCKKLPKVNEHPIGEKSPNLVNLFSSLSDSSNDGVEDDGHGPGAGVGLLQLRLVHVRGTSGRRLHGGRGLGAEVGLQAGIGENLLRPTLRISISAVTFSDNFFQQLWQK
jgi:hypothetical protein